MAPLNYPYQETMNVQLVDGNKRKRQNVIFANFFSAYFFHGGKKYNVGMKHDDLTTAIVYSVTDIPGHELPADLPEA